MIKSNKGFTLVELIVVIAILAILAGIAIPAYSGYIKKANEAADNTQLAAIKTAAMAACVTEGSVNSITVTTNTSTGAVTQIKINYGIGDGTDVEVISENDIENTIIDNNFKEVYIGTPPTLKSEKFKDGATWTSVKGEWE